MISKWFKQSFTLITLTPSTTFPYDMTETTSTFNGALASVSGSEGFQDDKISSEITHKIATYSSVSVSRAQKIGYGTRKFEILFVRPSIIKMNHHQELLCKEIV